MGVSCPPRCVGGISNNAVFTHALRRRWRHAFIAGGSRVASILRYTRGAAGDRAAGVPPNYTLDAALASLDVTVSQLGRFEGSGGDRRFVRTREGSLQFGFMDLPTSGGVDAGLVQLTDLIQFDDGVVRLWKPTTVRNDVGVLSYADCDLWQRAP